MPENVVCFIFWNAVEADDNRATLRDWRSWPVEFEKGEGHLIRQLEVLLLEGADAFVDLIDAPAGRTQPTAAEITTPPWDAGRTNLPQTVKQQPLPQTVKQQPLPQTPEQQPLPQTVMSVNFTELKLLT